MRPRAATASGNCVLNDNLGKCFGVSRLVGGKSGMEAQQVTPIEALRILIAERCAGRTNPDPVDIATWLITEKSGLLRLALDQLIAEAIEERDDNAGAEEVFETRPELREVDDELRNVAKTLNVSRSFLYSLETSKFQHALELTEAIYALWAEETATEQAALEQLREKLRPLLEGRDTRGMTVREACAEMDRQADEMLRKLESEQGEG